MIENAADGRLPQGFRVEVLAPLVAGRVRRQVTPPSRARSQNSAGSTPARYVVRVGVGPVLLKSPSEPLRRSPSVDAHSVAPSSSGHAETEQRPGVRLTSRHQTSSQRPTHGRARALPNQGIGRTASYVPRPTIPPRRGPVKNRARGHRRASRVCQFRSRIGPPGRSPGAPAGAIAQRADPLARPRGGRRVGLIARTARSRAGQMIKSSRRWPGRPTEPDDEPH